MGNRIETFKQMLEANPDNPMVLFGLANEYIKVQEFSEAIETLEDYLSKASDEGAAYGMLAKAYESVGDSEKAKETYKRGIVVSLENGHPSMAQDYQMTLEKDYL